MVLRVVNLTQTQLGSSSAGMSWAHMYLCPLAHSWKLIVPR